MRLQRTLMAAALLLAPACGDKPEQVVPVPIEQVPAPVMEAARKALPGVTLESAWKEKAGNEDAYEVRGRTDAGKIRDVKVSSSGKVLEID